MILLIVEQSNLKKLRRSNSLHIKIKQWVVILLNARHPDYSGNEKRGRGNVVYSENKKVSDLVSR